MREAAALAAVPAVPAVWTLLGYQFEAGAMIAALIACAATRFWAASTSGHFRIAVDAPVSILAMLLTAGMVARVRPEPFWAIVYGTGIGAMGATLITAAMAWVKRTSDVFAPPDRDHTAEPIAKLYSGHVQPTPPEMREQLDRLDEPKT